MPNSPLPLKIVNFNVYTGSNAFAGVASIKLPDFQFMADETRGAGIAGAIDFPVIGHLNDMTASISFFSVTEDALGLLAPVAQLIKARAGAQAYGFSNGNSALSIIPNRIEMQCLPKGFNPGSFDIASKSDANLELTVLTASYYLFNDRWLHVDKLGMVFEVNGVDYLADLRNAI